LSVCLENRSLRGSSSGRVIDLGGRGRDLLPVLVRGDLAGEVGRVSLRLVGVFPGVLGGEALGLLDLLIDGVRSPL